MNYKKGINRMTSKHIGSNFDDFLKEECIEFNEETFLERLAVIMTGAINRDYCRGCKFKIVCGIINYGFCKAYYDVLDEINSIIEEYEPADKTGK